MADVHTFFDRLWQDFNRDAAALAAAVGDPCRLETRDGWLWIVCCCGAEEFVNPDTTPITFPAAHAACRSTV